MARSATVTACILTDLYDETFKNDSCEPFRITWQQLRMISRCHRLTKAYLHAINLALNESNYALTAFDDSLLIAQESDFSSVRAVPDRIVEQYLAGVKEIDDEDDVEVDEDDLEASEENVEIYDVTDDGNDEE